MLMPILWRYLLRSYFQVFALCVSSFISVLLVTRFQEIARFASASASLGTSLLFVLFQVPIVLPLAIPISCLIGSILLFQRLSHAQELTALRTSGLGLLPITFPMLVAGGLASLLTFTVTSEISPLCRTLSKKLIYQTIATNPLIILQKDTMIKLKEAFVEMKVFHEGKKAEDVIFVIRNLSNERLGLMTAKELVLNKEWLTGSYVTFVSSLDSKKNGGFDHLVIENQAAMHTQASQLAQFLQDTDWYSSHDHLPMKMIFAKLALQNAPFGKFGKGHVEIARRFSLTLAAFLFTLIGTAYGMEIGRNRKKRGVIWAVGLGAFFMICFFSAKSFHHNPKASFFLYFAPHPLALLFCLNSLKRLSRGIE